VPSVPLFPSLRLRALADRHQNIKAPKIIQSLPIISWILCILSKFHAVIYARYQFGIFLLKTLTPLSQINLNSSVLILYSPTVYNAGEFRRALISHARDYNLTTKDVRRSFHMINLTDLELHSVSLDTNQPRRTVPYERYGQKRYIALATDGILTNIVAGEKDRDERYVGEKVHEYIRHHKNPEVAARYGKETEFYLGPPRDTIPAESKVTLVVADGGNADPVIYKAVGGIIVTETDEDSVQGLGSA
jgi:hypothetical protein